MRVNGKFLIKYVIQKSGKEGREHTSIPRKKLGRLRLESTVVNTAIVEMMPTKLPIFFNPEFQEIVVHKYTTSNE
jgi:hypothetical protein